MKERDARFKIKKTDRIQIKVRLASALGLGGRRGGEGDKPCVLFSRVTRGSAVRSAFCPRPGQTPYPEGDHPPFTSLPFLCLFVLSSPPPSSFPSHEACGLGFGWSRV